MKTNTNTKKNANGLHAYILGSFFLAASPVVHSANIWDGGGTNNSTRTATNWDNNVVPSAGNVSITFTGSTRTSVTWDGLSPTGSSNLTSIIFAAGASAFTINTGASTTATQFINGGTVISNQSSFLQTLKPSVNIFYEGTKTITGGTDGLALDGGIIFRGDTTWSGTNGLILTGTGNSTTSNIGEFGTFSEGETNALTKQGSGKWTITGDAIFRGVTTISEGTLELQGSITSSSITNTAALIFNHAGDQSYGNTISGSGGTLTKQGVGTLTLSGSNSYTGATNVDTGTLLINGSISTSSLTTVASGATIGGSGTVGSLTILDGGNLNPGTSPGTLSVSGGLSLGLSNLNFELTPGDFTVGGGINDLVSVIGNLTLDGILNLSPTSGDFASATAGNTWRLFNYTGDLTDNTLAFGAMPTLGSGLSWSVTAGSGQVNLAVIPEPSAALLGALGLLALLRRRRN